MKQREIDWPHYRPDDPESSREAWGKVRESVRVMCRAAAELVRQFPGMTAYELDALYRARNPDAKEGQLRKRLADTARMGLVCRGPRRACRVCGNNAVTWNPVPQG